MYMKTEASTCALFRCRYYVDNLVDDICIRIEGNSNTCNVNFDATIWLLHNFHRRYAR